MTGTAEEFAERLVRSSLGLIDVLAAYLGDRLGWYRALATDGPCTAEELVAVAGGATRYATGWLEQQATSGVLTVDPDGRFRLSAGAAEVLTDPDSPNYRAPLARMFGAAATQLPALLTVYRTGGAVSWDAFGDDMRESQADLDRPWFIDQLPAVLTGLPELAALRRPGALVADVGCGTGWSSIAIARTFPDANVEGWDVDRPSIDVARANGAAAGVEDRVVFSSTDASHLKDAAYDAIFAFECVHDMARPVPTLNELRRAVKPDGVVIIMDEAVADKIAPDGDDDRLMRGFSLFVCLRSDTLGRYAREAGFTGVEVLPTGDFGFWRFCKLTTT